MFYREFGIPHWKKYVKTQIGMLKLFGNRRDYSLSFTRALFCKIKTVLKIGIFTMVHLVGQTDCLVKMRDRKKSSFDRIKAMMDLQDAIK